MTALSVAETLRKAADLIEPEGAWTQADLARTKSGNTIGPLEKNAACWCALGALMRVCGDNMPTMSRAERALYGVLGTFGIPDWNDAFERTQAEVVAALRAAADASEAP